MPQTILTMVARKGGVGRTTLTMNLAGYYAKQGVRVLCIDLDGQASLSRAFLGSTQVESFRPSETAAAVFAGDATENIHPTDFENIFLMPSGDALEPYATPERRDFARDQDLLSECLHRTASEFDLVLIDTPPHTNVATVWSALCASDYVLSPVPADAFGVQSIASILNLVASIQMGPNPNLLILGYVLSMLQKNSVNNAYRDTLRRLHGSQVFTTEIPHAVAFKEAIAERKPLSHYKPRVKGAKLIVELAQEIEQRAAAISERDAA